MAIVTSAFGDSMIEIWLPLRDIPAEGREFSFSDPTLWTSGWKAYGLPWRMGKSLTAVLRLRTPEQGCLIEGRLQGTVIGPCDRCLEDAEIELDHELEEFEAFDLTQAESGKPGAHGRGTAHARRDDARTKPGSKYGPAEVLESEAGEALESSALTRWSGGCFELNVGALLWEMFNLALPSKPLCRPDCKGLCPRCGQNLNEGACRCGDESGDPRLAALRGLKVRDT